MVGRAAGYLWQGLVLLLLAPSFVLAAPQPVRIITDQLGRTVTVPKQVQRIIPLGGATRFVVYLQSFDRVVGVEAMENRMPVSAGRPYNLAIRTRADQLPVIGEGKQKPANPEAIMALRPDLIITAEGDRAQADQLSQRTGVPVVALDYGGMGVLKLDKVKDTLRLLGIVLGKDSRATYLTTYLDTQLRELKRRTGTVPRQSVYVGAVSHRGAHGITSTDSEYFPLRMLQATNLAATLGKPGHLYIDREQLLVWNPSLILLDAGGLSLVREEYSRDHEFFERLSAVSTGRVHAVLPYNNYHTNLELALANCWYLAKVLQPDQFASVDPTRKTDEICRAFVGISCYEQLRREYGGFGRLRFAAGTILHN